MPSFTFEGFDTGTAVSLSATQAGNTVSESVAAWGGPSSGTATIAIAQTETTMTQYDSVRFTPTGWDGFDTPEAHAPSGNIYKPRLHDIIYFWDTGRTGEFTAPQNLLPQHRSRRYGHGPVCLVCYDVPGTYTVRLYAYEPSSGKYAISTTTVIVNSADSDFPGSQTICINPNGDNDFSSAPSGAQTVQLAAGNVFDETHPSWISNRGGAKKRFLFKGSSTYDIRVIDDTSNITDGIMFGSYGTGKATSYRTSGSNFGFSNWTEIAPGVPKRCLIHNLRFTGNFDPTTHTGHQGGVISNFGAGGTHFVMHNCEIDGIGGTVFNGTGAATLNQYFHLDDVLMTNIGGQYPVLMDDFTHPEASCGLTGCCILRDPQSNFDEGFSGLGGSQRAPIRINGHAWCYLQACDVYQNTGDQPALKLAERGDTPGGVYSVHCCTLESANGGVMRFKWNAAAGVHTNLILRQNILITGHSTSTFAMGIKGQGCSIDSNLVIAPGTLAQNPEETRGVCDFDRRDGNPGPGDSPNYVRNNTAVHYKDGTENLTTKFDTVINRSSLMSITQGCNLEHKIGFGTVPFAPLEDGPVGVALFNSRNTGRYQSGIFDTGWATAPNEMYSFQPEVGSSALGARTSEAFYSVPIDGQTENDIRQVSVDFGCWQGAV